MTRIIQEFKHRGNVSIDKRYYITLPYKVGPFPKAFCLVLLGYESQAVEFFQVYILVIWIDERHFGLTSRSVCNM